MKLIIHGEPNTWGLAIACAKWLAEQPASQREVIISYGQAGAYFAKRNKASVTVRQCGPQTSTLETDR
jgi:hypothetical protein